MPMSLFVYSTATRLLEPFSGFALNRRLKSGKERDSRLPERFGKASVSRPSGKLVWMHGASVGETAMLLSIFKHLRELIPDLQALITSQTLTSADMLASKADQGIIHQMAPIDAPKSVDRFLKHWQPDSAILAEGEIWPNLIRATHKRKIPLNLINARMTDKSIKGWKSRSSAAKKIFDCFQFIGAADNQTALGLEAIVSRPPDTIGNLKRAIEAPTCDKSEFNDWLRFSLDDGKRLCILAASTHAGEEKLAINAFQKVQQNNPNTLLIIAPRHPERAAEIIQLLEAENLSFQQRSLNQSLHCSAPVLLADTIGEMGLWMNLCDAVYLGGANTTGIGGHNPIEPLKLRKPVFTGPDTFNFSDLMTALEPCNAIVIGNDAEKLAKFWNDVAQKKEDPNLDSAFPDLNTNWDCVDSVFSAVDKPLALTLNTIKAQLEE